MRRISWLLLLAACAPPVDKDPDAKTAHGRTAEDDKRFKEYAARGEVRIGMVKSEVKTAWGEPGRTKRTTFRRKSATCWSYPDRYADIYFDDEGYVIGYQSATG